jgi:hypothetical protein
MRGTKSQDIKIYIYIYTYKPVWFNKETLILLQSRLSTLAAHCSHLGTFKNYWCLNSNTRDSNLIAMGHGLGIGTFKNSPTNYNIQPKLRSIALGNWHHYLQSHQNLNLNDRISGVHLKKCMLKEIK